MYRMVTWFVNVLGRSMGEVIVLPAAKCLEVDKQAAKRFSGHVWCDSLACLDVGLAMVAKRSTGCSISFYVMVQDQSVIHRKQVKEGFAGQNIVHLVQLSPLVYASHEEGERKPFQIAGSYNKLPYMSLWPFDSRWSCKTYLKLQRYYRRQLVHGHVPPGCSCIKSSKSAFSCGILCFKLMKKLY